MSTAFVTSFSQRLAPAQFAALSGSNFCGSRLNRQRITVSMSQVHYTRPFYMTPVAKSMKDMKNLPKLTPNDLTSVKKHREMLEGRFKWGFHKYGEILNGRVAMVAFIIVFLVELVDPSQKTIVDHLLSMMKH